MLRWKILVMGAGGFCFLALQAQERPSQVADPAPNTSEKQSAISTVQSAPVSFRLKPTAVAPAEAAGSAELNNDRLSFHLSHLNPGNYVVEGLSGADLVAYRLGVIAIADPTSSPGRQANDNKREASAHPESTHLEIDVKMTLAAEFSSLQIDHLRLLGSAGNAVLEGSSK